MAHPIARAAGRSLLASVLVTALVPVVLLVVFGLPALVAWLLPVDEEVRLMVFGGGLLTLLFTFAVAAIGFAAFRTGVLDPAFDALGMRGRSVIPNIRHYTGQHGGRATFGMYARRGGVLELGIEQTTGGQAAFTRQQTVGRVRELIGLSPLAPSADPDLAGVVSAGADAGWTAALLASPGVPAALRTLLDDASGREIRWVLVRPACVKVVRRFIDPDAAGATLASHAQALDTVATACVRLGPPPRPIVESRFERSARQSPMTTAFAAVGCILLFVLGLGAVGGGILLLAVQRPSTPASDSEPPAALDERGDGEGRHPHPRRPRR